MMEHTDRKCVIKDSRERQVIDVCLDDVRIRQFASRGKGSFHRVAKIDTDYVSRPKLRRQLRMPSLSTTAFEHNFVFEEFSGDWSYPGKKLILVTFLKLIEVLPLPTKFRGGGRFVLFHFINRSKARHPTHNGPNFAARIA